MFKINLKQKLIIIAVIIGVFLIFISLRSTSSKPKPSASSTKEPFLSAQATTNDKPQIVSTKPDPLEDAIIPANQVIEVTFNRPLENSGEFKLRVEPKIDYKIELSQDRKTAKIITNKPYELGSTYTIFIGPETKFDGVGRWGEEKIFHFRTIRYRGI